MTYYPRQPLLARQSSEEMWESAACVTAVREISTRDDSPANKLNYSFHGTHSMEHVRQ